MARECKIRKGKQTYASGFANEFTVEGYYVTVPTVEGTSTAFVEDLSTAFSIIGKYDNEADEIEKRAKALAEYCINNKWTYAGT